MLNTKLLTKLFVIFFLMFNLTKLHAEGLKNKFFLGVDGQYIFYTLYGVPGASVFGGYRWDCLGLELGYTKHADEHWGDNIILKSQNVYLDLLGFYPLSDCFEIKGLVGAGAYNIRVTNKSTSVISQIIVPNKAQGTFAGFRAGLGLQYNMNDCLAADLTYKVQTNPVVLMGFMSIFSLGLHYHF